MTVTLSVTDAKTTRGGLSRLYKYEGRILKEREQQLKWSVNTDGVSAT